MALYVRCGLLSRPCSFSRLFWDSFRRRYSSRPFSGTMSFRQGLCSMEFVSENASYFENHNYRPTKLECATQEESELRKKINKQAGYLKATSMTKTKICTGQIHVAYLPKSDKPVRHTKCYNGRLYSMHTVKYPKYRIEENENEYEEYFPSWTALGKQFERKRAENDRKIKGIKKLNICDNNHVIFKHEEPSDLEANRDFAEESIYKTVKQIELSNTESLNENEPFNENESINQNENKIEKVSPFKMAQEKIRADLGRIYDKILVVNDIHSARKVVEKLTSEYRDFVHACDTEVSKIEVKKETPVEHGEMISFSIFSSDGENKAEFGDGKCCIWVDVLDGEENLMNEFKPFFEDESIKKVWHNYSFDSHIIQNYDIKLAGFHADTMHLARIYDSNRRIDGGYSLEALSSNQKLMDGKPDYKPGSKNPQTPINNIYKDLSINLAKASMKSIFGKKKLKKNGEEGLVITLDKVDILQREEKKHFICYSALDSISTLRLFESLRAKLNGRDWVVNNERKGSMFDFYEKWWRPFGELLVKMERRGMLVDRDFLKQIEVKATNEQRIAGAKFRNWASEYCPDAMFMNVGSDTQIRQILFGGIANSADPCEALPMEKKFKIPNPDYNPEPEDKIKQSKFKDITLCKIGEGILTTEAYTPSGWPSVSADSLKVLSGKIPPEFIYSENQDLDSRIPEYGTAYEAFGGGDEGKKACVAIAALCEICSIDALISNFIKPLQGKEISCKNGRVHCSLNINTETGRLSARTPNLQNQPALEKDRYKIRKAFIAKEGHSLIVADYGQLELRILAHMTNCKSMLEAFRLGGDFHSRTAMNMYDYISRDVEDGKVLLEWKPQPGEDKPPLPLIKDVYGAERRKAKMLNFSIAYGKTAMGLAMDWKVSKEEAEETVRKWYNARKEVQKWQKEQKLMAKDESYVRTLLGRERHFPKMETLTPRQRGHISRAAINTPIQGSAADVAMCAMLEIEQNPKLKSLGWELLLQVHDEVILEGPSESAEEAKAIVVECMSKPFNGTNNLSAELAVDAKCAKSWYEAK